MLVTSYSFYFSSARLPVRADSCLVLLSAFLAVAIEMSRACLIEVLCTLDISIPTVSIVIKRTKHNSASYTPIIHGCDALFEVFLCLLTDFLALMPYIFLIHSDDPSLNALFLERSSTSFHNQQLPLLLVVGIVPVQAYPHHCANKLLAVPSVLLHACSIPSVLKSFLMPTYDLHVLLHYIPELFVYCSIELY